MDIATVADLLRWMTPEEEAQLTRLLRDVLFCPNPGPQLAALNSEAYELFYGGSAGGGKSFLLLGLACTRHHKSLILRREATQLLELVQQSHDMIGGRGKFNGSSHIWRLPTPDGLGRMIELGGCKDEQSKQKFKGRSHSLKAFDEVSDFTESVYTFVSAWCRTVIPGERCRVVAAGNPPMTAEGEWVIRRWAPWLDRQHPRPAKPGDLRWYAMLDGKEVEREGGSAFEWKGEIIRPKSRTFIPARLTDNPLLMASGYGTTLQNLPEPMRSMLLYGDFTVGREDDAWQVIPTEWVRKAQERWKETPQPDGPPTVMGCDPARGGACATVITKRWGGWFARPEKHAGTSTPDGPRVVGLIAESLAKEGEGAGRCPVHVDVIGIGAAVYDLCKQAGLNVDPINNSKGVKKRDRSNVLRFANLRAWAYWQLREALDPDLGENLCLPPDPELLSDLCAARWSHGVSGILVEPKEDIIERIGRSPDLGDSLIMCAMPPKGAWAMESF